jgi:hypothetical protein
MCISNVVENEGENLAYVQLVLFSFFFLYPPPPPSSFSTSVVSAFGFSTCLEVLLSVIRFNPLKTKKKPNFV